MKITHSIAILVSVTLVSSEESAPDLCSKSNLWIDSADRLPNNSILIYKNNYYWELTGLPGRSGQAKGPYKIWWQHMVEVKRGMSVATVLTGSTAGLTYKFSGNRFWIFDSKTGKNVIGGKAGYNMPSGLTGCNAALNDGGMAGKGFPITICFSGTKVYYFDMRDKERFRDISRGKDKDVSFPSDVTAAFAYPADDPKAKFNVYLFKKRQYCFRPYIGDQDCEWKENSELFGCGGKSAEKPEPEKPKPEKAEPEKKAEKTSTNDGCNRFSWIQSALVFATLLNILIII